MRASGLTLCWLCEMMEQKIAGRLRATARHKQPQPGCVQQQQDTHTHCATAMTLGLQPAWQGAEAATPHLHIPFMQCACDYEHYIVNHVAIGAVVQETAHGLPRLQQQTAVHSQQQQQR